MKKRIDWSSRDGCCSSEELRGEQIGGDFRDRQGLRVLYLAVPGTGAGCVARGGVACHPTTVIRVLKWCVFSLSFLFMTQCLPRYMPYY